MLAHDLHNQVLPAQIAQFVEMLDGKVDDPLEAGLVNIHDPSVCNVLAQKHAEIGGGHGTCLIGLRQIDQWQGRAGGQIEPLLPGGGLDGQKQFVRFRLGDLCDSSVLKLFF